MVINIVLFIVQCMYALCLDYDITVLWTNLLNILDERDFF